MFDGFRRDDRIDRADRGAAETLSPDLEAIHVQLVADSDGWARRLPEATAVAGYLRMVAAGTAPADTPPAPDDAAIARANIVSRPLPPATPPRDLPTGKRPPEPGRARTVVAVAAAVAIVVLMAGVLRSLAPGQRLDAGKAPATVQPTETPMPTATPRPPFGPVRGDWSAVPGLKNLQGRVVIAPSNPSVVYETAQTQGSAMQPVGQDAVLRRSDDGGATWHDVAVPAPSDPAVTSWGPAEVLVSPADPNVIVVGVASQLSTTTPAACPPDLRMADVRATPDATSLTSTNLADTKQVGMPERSIVPSNGFVRCSVQYASSDGGAHWTKINLAGIGATANGLTAIAAQEGRLYGTVLYDDQQGSFTGVHLLMAADGINWHLVDAPLLGMGRHICDFAAAPSGSTVFAKTNTGVCFNFAPDPDELWRSDDAGAHWRDLGPLGGRITTFGAAEQGPNDREPTLYVHTANTPTAEDMHLQVSVDGGLTWHASPAAGLPTGYKPLVPVAGALSDGSLVEMFTSDLAAGPHTPVTVAFYAWHAGDSEWHQIAPVVSLPSNLDATDVSNQFLATPNGGVHGTLWHIQYTPFPANVWSVERYAL